MTDTREVQPFLRLALVACLLLGLLSASAGSALAMPHAKRLAKACKQRKSVARSSTVARPTPIRAGDAHKRAAVNRPRRKRCVQKKVKAKRNAAKPNAPAGAPSAPGGHESSQPGPSSPAAPGTTAPEPGGDTTAPLPPSNPRALQVISTEFSLALSKAEVLAGGVRVEFNNMFAEDPHDLHLVREDGTGDSFSFGELQAGEVEAKTVPLTAGRWQLFCALPEHLQRGMSARLRVRAG